MTKEDIAAMISGKPPAPDGREIHSYSIDMNQMEPIVKSIFQDDRQAAYAETLAKLAKFYTNTLVPEIAVALEQAAIFVYRQMFPTEPAMALRGVCFTRNGWVVATIFVRVSGICLGVSAKTLTAFEGGFSEEAVVMVVKDFMEKSREEDRVGTRVEQRPEQIAKAIIAAVAKLPKEG